MAKRRFKEVFISSADPFERGFQHGSQVRDLVLRICEGYKKSFARKGFTWDEAQMLALKYVPGLDAQMPDLMQEARGIAAGADVSLGVVMVLNARYELLKLKKSADAHHVAPAEASDAECTCFALLPEATADGHALSGQNWDKDKFVEDDLYVLHIDEKNGTRIVGLSEPAQLIRNGMNTHGLSLNCSTLLSVLDGPGLAAPTNFVRRRLLSCRSFEEATRLVREFHPDIALNYLIASKDGEAIVFETTPRENFFIEPTRGVLTKANDMVCDPTLDRFIPASKGHHRHFRAQRLNELFKKRRGHIDIGYVQECLRDHYGDTESVCNHCEAEGLKTIASMIYDLTEGRVLMAWGNPCENEYEEYIL